MNELDACEWETIFQRLGAPVAACPHVKGHSHPEHPCVRDLLVPFPGREEIRRMIWAVEGEPHHRPRIALFEVSDGRTCGVVATCCGAGWECHAACELYVARDLETLWRFGVGEEGRRALDENEPAPLELLRLEGRGD